MDIILVYYLLGKFIVNTIISYSDKKTNDSILEKPECDYTEITKDIKDESIKNFRDILKNNFKEEDLKSKACNTPFLGWKVKGELIMNIVDGQLLVEE